MSDVSDQAEDLGHRANDNEWMERGVRFGMICYGVVYLLIAWLALQLALGSQHSNASSKGALQLLGQQSFGPVLLWLVAIGLTVLVIWRALEALVGHQEYDGGKRTRRRLMSAGKAVIYGYVAYLAFRYAIGAGSSGSTDSTTAKLMDQPFGRFLVGLVGVAIAAYGVAQIRRGWTEKFMENLDARGSAGDTGKAYRLIGKVGYIAKGIAFILVGGLFVAAAFTHHAKKSGNLDQALQTLLGYPFGQVLLILIAAGIACYGLFCFARARHLSR
jgi:hypothetical protein